MLNLLCKFYMLDVLLLSLLSFYSARLNTKSKKLSKLVLYIYFKVFAKFHVHFNKFLKTF